MKALEQLQFMTKVFYKIGILLLLLNLFFQCSDNKYDEGTMHFKVFAQEDDIIYSNGFTDYLITKYKSGKVKYYRSLKVSKNDTLKTHIIVSPEFKKECRYAIVYSLKREGIQKVNLKVMIKKKGTDNRYTVSFMNLGSFSYKYKTKEDLKKWLHDCLAKATYKCCYPLKPD
ncbi:hypothetical protein [Aquimarina longa]|uniref:hypothetical protein n=1 Tax=Aquimarina longa TaxID=1080221 RepID=UPI0007840C2E|nr:hypothetical protein [Aquimarina longa]